MTIEGPLLLPASPVERDLELPETRSDDLMEALQKVLRNAAVVDFDEVGALRWPMKLPDEVVERLVEATDIQPETSSRPGPLGLDDLI